MKRLLSLLLAIGLVGGVLYWAKADVNHGHGPGHHVEESTDSHGESTH